MNVKADVTLLSSEQFEEDVNRARHAAEGGPVFILTDGAVSHVLMTKRSFDELQPAIEQTKPDTQRALNGQSLADALAYKGEGGDFDWEPPRFGTLNFKPVDFD